MFCLISDDTNNNRIQVSNGPTAIQKLSTPVTLGKLFENNTTTNEDEPLRKNIMDIKKSDITVNIDKNLFFFNSGDPYKKKKIFLSMLTLKKLKKLKQNLNKNKKNVIISTLNLNQ
jgi:hypothetical protein